MVKDISTIHNVRIASENIPTQTFFKMYSLTFML